MKQIIARILKSLRSVLSRLRSAPAASPRLDIPRMDARPSEPQQPSSSGMHEAPIDEVSNSATRQSLQAFKADESLEIVRDHGGRDVREGKTDSQTTGAGTADALVQQEHPTRIEDATAEGETGSQGASEGEIASPPLLRDDRIREEQAPGVADGGIEPDSTLQQPQRNVEAPAEPSVGNEEPNNAPEERDVAGDAVNTRCFSPHDETSHESPEGPMVLDCGTCDGRVDERGSSEAEDVGAGGITAGIESAQETAHQEEELPSAAPPEPADVENGPVIDASNTTCPEQDAEEADIPLSIPPVVPSEGLRERGDSSEEQGAASKDTPESGSGAVDRPLIGEEEEESVQGASRAPSQRRPTPSEDAREYAVVIQDVSSVDREYARWNRVIVEQLLLANPSSEEAYLCINPRILARLLEDGGTGLLTPEQAEQQFSTAVASVYRRRVLAHNARLRVLRRCSSGEPPDCTAFLAGSVLAAFRMQSDEEVSGNAYYTRFADLLGCGTQGVHPVGFDPAVFESLWIFLSNWLNEVHGRRLAMPKGNVGFRRFVALPLAHVPLRALDVDKLPAFFAWAGYQPSGRVQHTRLLSDLGRWQQSRNVLTPTGAEALSDERSAAVAAQVSAELESWDGSFYESASRRSALVEIQFDIVQRNPLFFYLPRRPTGFPEVFDGGERVFEASDEGWYDPAQIRPEDGGLLERGFEWLSQANGIHFALRRPGAVVVPFTPSSTCSGFLTSRRLLRGVKCSVLCRDNILANVKEYLSEVAQNSLEPVSHPLLPNGWSMFRDVSARVQVDAPPGLEAIEVDPNVDLIVAGGLRIGRRWSWLAGAPPRILVSGMKAQDHIKVNGTSVEVGANGDLLTGEVFSEPGEYFIEAGRVRRKIEIARPRVSVQEEADRQKPLDGRPRRVALPQGTWTLIGCSPDQVCCSHEESFRGSIASCPFEPSWAIQVGAGPGATVAATLHQNPRRPMDLHRLIGKSRKVAERWSSIIYEAHIRRPRFIGLNGVVPDECIVDAWRQYTTLAKRIKRKLKRRQ